jgi:hypothetical protein
LFIPRVSFVRHGTSLVVLARQPDGRPITASTLRVTLFGFWAKRAHRLGVKSPIDGIAAFTLKLPASVRRTTIQLRARCEGAGWLRASSNTRSVFVR